MSKPIRVLTNTAEVIDLLATRGPLSVGEISELIDVPRPSVYRLVEALNGISLTETGADSRIDLSRRWLHLADATRRAMTEWKSARTELNGLVEETGQTAFLSVPRSSGAVCIDWAQGRGIGVLLLKPGRSLPYHAGAAGRILLAYGDNQDNYLMQAPFERFTPHTLVTAEELAADIAQSRKQGYAISDEDVTLGIGAIGVPVTDGEGQACAALSLGGLAGEMKERQQEFIRALRGAAARLTPAS